MKKAILALTSLMLITTAHAEIHEIIINPDLTFNDVLPQWSKNIFKRIRIPPSAELVVDCKGDTDCEKILNAKSYHQIKELYETLNSTPLKLPEATSLYSGRCYSNMPGDNPATAGLGALYVSIDKLNSQIFIFGTRLAGNSKYPADYADHFYSDQNSDLKYLLLSYGETPFEYLFKNDQNGKETILGETQGGVTIIGKIKQINATTFLIKVTSKEFDPDEGDPSPDSIKKDEYCKIMKKNF